MGKAPSCSIILVTYNNLEYTRQCIDAIFMNVPENCELIFVDNGSTDGTVQFLQDLTFRSTVRLYNGRNLGFGKGANQGALAASGKHLLFLNPDTIPQKNWLSEMTDAIERFPKIGIVGSRLLFPDGTIQHGGVAFGGETFTIHLHKGEKENYPPALIPKILQAVTGACLLIPRSLFFQVGKFDERFINGFEDIDLCFKVRKAGFRVLYWPKSELIHFESVSDGRRKYDKKNMLLFMEKWKGFHVPDTHVFYGQEGAFPYPFAAMPEHAISYFYDIFASLAASETFSLIP